MSMMNDAVAEKIGPLDEGEKILDSFECDIDSRRGFLVCTNRGIKFIHGGGKYDKMFQKLFETTYDKLDVGEEANTNLILTIEEQPYRMKLEPIGGPIRVLEKIIDPYVEIHGMPTPPITDMRIHSIHTDIRHPRNNAKSDETIITVKDIMTRGIISVLPETNVVEAVKVMSDRDISSILVMTEGKYVGILTDRDVMKKVIALGLDPKTTNVQEIMSTPLITVSENTGIAAAAEKMRDRKIRKLVVKNDLDVVGVISETDIARVEPELHLLIREHTRLQFPSSNFSEDGKNFAGYCEDCDNYSSLETQDGRWLCKECRYLTKQFPI